MSKLSACCNSEKIFASYVFPDKNQKPLHMCRVQISKQAVAILSLISGNVEFACVHQNVLGRWT